MGGCHRLTTTSPVESCHMSCRHRGSQLASVEHLLEFGPWAAQPSVESAGGMENLPRWTAEGCELAATSTTRPLVRHLT